MVAESTDNAASVKVSRNGRAPKESFSLFHFLVFHQLFDRFDDECRYR